MGPGHIPKKPSAPQEEGKGEQLSRDTFCSGTKTAPVCPGTSNPLKNCTKRLQRGIRVKSGSEQPCNDFKQCFVCSI